MKIKILLVALISYSVIYAQEADTSYWKLGGAATLTFSQVSLTNWAAGGDNSVSLNGYFNVFGDYAKDRVSWSNNVEMGYGIIKQGEASAKKTDDIIIATTQLGLKISEKLFWSSLLDFRTQFYEGKNDNGERISDFMAPGYLLVATGLDWKPIPVFSLTCAPVTGKFTFVNDEELATDGAFGVDPGLRDPVSGSIIEKGRSSRAELGSFLKVRFIKENILKNVNISSKLELFTNYMENQGEIDVNWQNQVIMKVNSLITVNLQTQLIWDEDIKFEKLDTNGDVISSESKIQYKNVFGVGISYAFGQKKE